MWVLFAVSFQNQLTAVLGYDAATARAITKKAKLKYRQIIRMLPQTVHFQSRSQKKLSG